MNSKNLSNNGKKNICRIVIRPIVTLASETLCVIKDDERKSAAWERKILQRIYGLVFENDEWRIQNNELYELYGELQIIGEMKSSRLQWAGHIERRDEKSLIVKVLNGKPAGKRCIYRPRKKRLEEDIKVRLPDVPISRGESLNSYLCPRLKSVPEMSPGFNE